MPKTLILFDTFNHPINDHEKRLLSYLFGNDQRVDFVPQSTLKEGQLSGMVGTTLVIRPEKLFESGFELSGYLHEIAHIIDPAPSESKLKMNYGLTERDSFEELSAILFEIFLISKLDGVWAKNHIKRVYQQYLKVNHNYDLDFDWLKLRYDWHLSSVTNRLLNLLDYLQENTRNQCLANEN